MSWVGSRTPPSGPLKNKKMGLDKINAQLKSGKIDKAEAARRIAQCNSDKGGKQKKKSAPKKGKNKVSKMEKQISNAAVATKNATFMKGKSIYTGTGNMVSSSNPVKAYLKALVNPMMNMARIPDSYDRPTAVFRSISSFSPPILQDNFNQGRFSFCLKPIFGDTSSPTHYQAAIANPQQITSGNWANVDWSNSTYYVSTGTMGRDPRVDINAPFLTTPPPSFYGNSFGVGTPDLASNVLVSGIASNQTPFSDNNGSTFNIYSPAAPAPFTSATGGYVQLPFGDWAVTIFAKFSVSTVPGTGWEAINFQAPGNGVTRVNMYQPQTSVSATGVTYNAAALAQVVSVPGGNRLGFNIAPVQTGTDVNNTPGANITVTSTTIEIAPANFSSSSTFLSGGVIEEVRPVAMATLVTYMGTTLNNGGEVAISYCPQALVANNYFQMNGAGVGQLQLYENLRNLDNAYDGALRDGCYCIWAPYSGEDLDLYSPDMMNAHPYPAIICSGVFSPDATVNSIQATVRVEVFIVYEFVTKYTMFETVHQPGTQAAIDAALSTLKGQPFGCKNKEHLQWVRNFLANAGKFYKDNAFWINPGATALMGML